MNFIQEELFKTINNAISTVEDVEGVIYGICGSENEKLNDQVRNNIINKLNDIINYIGSLEYCEECEELKEAHDLKQHPFNNKRVCNSCYDALRNQVKSYHTAKNNGFKTLNHYRDYKTPFLLGFELELELKEDYDVSDFEFNKILYNYRDFLNYEKDGSLRNGFETVSNTLSINYYENLGKNHLKHYLNDLKDYVRTSTRTGLHIHINKDVIEEIGGVETLHKLLRFFDNNIYEWGKISNRLSFEYADTDISNYDNIDTWERNIYDIVSEDRYSFINITSKTIEFRLFQASKQFEIINRQINTIILLIDWLKWLYDEDILTAVSYIEFEEFLSFVKFNNETVYNFLKERLES